MGNEIAKQKAEAASSDRVSVLDLKGLGLVQLPEREKRWEQYGHLRSVLLDGNSIQKLPSGLARLTSLTELTVEGNRLRKLPDEVCSLTNLRVLNFKYNKLEDLPANFGRLSQLKSLVARGNQLGSTPQCVGTLTSLQILALGNNGLVSPGPLWRLTQLTYLDLQCNRLTTLPDEIGELQSLAQLNLRGNNLVALPDAIGRLTALEELIAWDNTLTHVPSSIQNCISLVKIGLSENSLTALPKEIGNLARLRRLYLQHNRISVIPTEVTNLRSLHTFLLHDNNIDTVPVELGLMGRRLREFTLAENPLKGEIKFAASSGTAALVQYLFKAYDAKYGEGALKAELRRQANAPERWARKENEAKVWIATIILEDVSHIDFADLVADGTVLCRVLNHVHPGAIKSWNARPKNNKPLQGFEVLENVALFLKGCAELNIPDQFLFREPDLLKRTDIRQVILTVHAIARYAEKRGVKPVLGTPIPSIGGSNIAMRRTRPPLTSQLSRKFVMPDIHLFQEACEFIEGVDGIREWSIVLPTKGELEGDVETLVGPDNGEDLKSNGPTACGQASSTYPMLVELGNRIGDPICDRFVYRALSRYQIAVLADGCNWGNRVRDAAVAASDTVANYIFEHLVDLHTVEKAGNFLVRSLSFAHNAIVEGKEEWEAGTTTLMAAVSLPLASPAKDGSHRFALVCVNIGDCKTFLYRHKEKKVVDVSHGNRQSVIDASDCGGRLGPYVGKGKPDLRNLKVFYHEVFEGDIVMVMSDGVHDNFDPQTLGKKPSEFNLDAEKWSDLMQDTRADEVKTNYRETKLKEVAFSNPDEIDCVHITEKLIKYCHGVTSTGRTHMEENPHSRLPDNYEEFPGKMDHSSCVVFEVK